MKRYAFFPRIGNGSGGDEFRPSVADLPNVTYKWSFGEIILHIAQQIDPLWPNLNNFDVSEPAQ